MKMREASMKRFFLIGLGFLCFLSGRVWAEGLDYSPIQHIIIIYQENWSFDGLFGKFPGADGLDQAGAAVSQVDLQGKPLPSMPQPWLDPKKKVLDDRFPATLPVGPYDLTQYV